MRLALAATAVALTLAGAAYGTGGRSVVVTIEATASDGRHVVAVARAKANGREVPLAWVEALVPDPLPPHGTCGRVRVSTEVTVAFANGRMVSYGPCLPQRIKWLKDALFSEAAHWTALVARPPAIIAARPAEARELRRLVRELGLASVHRIELRLLTRRVKMIVDEAPGRSSLIRLKWEAELLARRYNAVAGPHRLREIIGLRVGNGGGSVEDQGIDPPASDLEQVQRFVAGADARIVELRTIAGEVAITVRTARPAAFLKYHGLGFFDVLLGPSASPAYFAVQNAHGSVVYAAGSGLWARPELVACGPVSHFGPPPGYESPPCPA